MHTRARAAKSRDVALPSRAISLARGHLRVSRFARRTTEKRETARSLVCRRSVDNKAAILSYRILFYGKAPPKRDTFLSVQVYERAGISLVEAYERVWEICDCGL